ncbi:MAG: fibronectin type III domain-containing protein [Treponema sp.]|nr:fibronectin type III domain-containing protein [Treponema sp.]
MRNSIVIDKGDGSMVNCNRPVPSPQSPVPSPQSPVHFKNSRFFAILAVLALTLAFIGCPDDGGSGSGSSEKIIDSISITMPDKEFFVIDEDLDEAALRLLFEDFVITVNYVDGTSQLVGIENCVVTGFDPDKEGEQEITIRYGGRGGKSVTFTVYVYSAENFVPVEGISLDKTEITIPAGGSETLEPLFDPDDATEKRVRWESDNPALAAVDAYGVITVPEGAAGGTAVITVTTVDGGHQAACVVTVTTDGEPVQDLEDLAVDLTAGDGRVTLAPQAAAEGFVFYYNKSAAPVAAPAYGAAITTITGAAVYITVTDIAGTNGTPIFVQVYKVETTDNTITGFGQNDATPVTTPSAPGSFTATAGNAQVILTWVKSGDGGSVITKYQYSYGAAGGYTQNWIDIPGSNADTTTCTVTGLANGTSYTFEVRAINAIGNGASSGTQTAAPTPAATEPAPPSGFTVTVGNAQVTLSWTTPSNGGSAITKYQYLYNPGSPTWTDIPGSGPGTTSYTVTSLTNGTSYTFEVRAVNAIGNGTSSGQQIATPATTPAAPGSFTAVSGNGQVTLSWATPNNGGSVITKYQYSYGAAGGYTQNWTDIPGSNVEATSYTVTSLTNGTSYTFEVRAVNAIGNGASSGTQTATPTPDATVPAAPGGFTAVPGNSQVTLTWTTPGNGGSAITKYQYSYGAAGGYTQNWTDIPGSNVETTSYTVTSLTNGTSYTFEVRAVNAIGNGASSGIQTATPTPAATAPAAPGDFTAVPGNSQVTLTWTMPSDGGSAITKYQYLYVPGLSTWTDIPGSGAGTTSYIVTGLANGTSYAFEIRAVNAVGNSTSSGSQTAMPATTPSAPIGLTATPGAGQVTLSWATPNNGGSAIIKYQYLYVPGLSTWADIPDSGAGTISYIVTGLVNDTSYTFEVRAVNAAGNGTTSGQQTATPTPDATVPAAPGSFTAMPGNSQVTLTWATPGDGGSAITKYQYLYNPGSPTWTDIPGSGPGTTSYTVTSLTNGTSYTFEVRAVNAIGNGESSGQQQATPATTPSAPGSFTAVPGNGQVVLSWAAPSNNGGSAITGYEVSSNSGGTWVSASSDTGHTFTGLINGTPYTFRVRAVNVNGTGAESTATATPVTVPGAVSTFSAIPGSGQVILWWTEPLSDGGLAITHYEVSSDNGSSWVTASSNTGHTFTGLSNGTQYIFRVRAVNSAGAGTENVQTAIPVFIPTVPGAVTNFIATPSNTEVVLSWAAPASDGGSAINSYHVSSDDGENWITASNNTSHTFTGLTNATLYIFKVRAANSVGPGVESTITATPFTIPGAVSGFMATSANGQVVLSWTTPHNGGSAITKYQYSYGATSGYSANWSDIPGSGESTMSYIVTSLTNGTNYTFEVCAVNIAGNGTTSGQQTATPATNPFPSPDFTATPGNNQVTLSWTKPNDGGSAITKYQYSYGATSGYSANWSDIPGSGESTMSYIVTSLTNGTSYSFQVRAVNSVGNGTAFSVRTATPATVPSAPTGFTAMSGNSQVTLTWTTPNNGGSAILRYQYSYGATSGYSTSWSDIPSSGAGTTSHTVTGLANGTSYTFEVHAVNIMGDGTTSGQRTAIPLSAPSAPADFTVTPDNGQVALSWTTPDNGGTTILRYQYSYGASSGYSANWINIPGSSASTMSYSITSLTNGTNYTFEVRAVNSVGDGITSGTQTATPATMPSAPASFTATPGAGQVVLSWTTPNTGGSEILRYQYSYGATSGYSASWSDVPGSGPGTTSYTVGSLTNGTSYTFEVRAVNIMGNGTSSVQRTATPVSVPGEVSTLTVSSSSGFVSFMWYPPFDNGGSAVTHYQVSSDNGMNWITTTYNDYHVFTGLTDGTQYVFKIRAVNAVGAGIETTVTATPGYIVRLYTRAPAISNPESIVVVNGQPYGTLPVLTPPPVTGATVTFNGWWTAATGGTQVTSSSIVTLATHHSLYAQWIFSSTYNIGATGPGTGTIFYVADGQAGRPLGFWVQGYTGATGSFTDYLAYYLEAAPSNSGAGQWGANGTFILGVAESITPIDDIIGTGRRDTLTIAAYLAGIPETGRAAQLALAANFGGLNDWFLPSSPELNLLYLQRTLPGIGITTGSYWSSWQFEQWYSWAQAFTDGYRDGINRPSGLFVRAIRAF